jgi:hypothetical protein
MQRGAFHIIRSVPHTIPIWIDRKIATIAHLLLFLNSSTIRSPYPALQVVIRSPLPTMPLSVLNMPLQLNTMPLQLLQCHCQRSTCHCSSYNAIVNAQHAIAAPTMPLSTLNMPLQLLQCHCQRSTCHCSSYNAIAAGLSVISVINSVEWAH